jgi:hypothetical protein
VITLSDTFMNTRFGGRQRPHFQIKRWMKLGGESEMEALPPPKPAQQTTAQPSLQEELNDSIPQ